MAAVETDRLARLGVAAVRALGAGGAPTRDELEALAEADGTITSGQLDELTRAATKTQGRIERAGTTMRVALDALQPGDAPADTGGAAQRLGAAARRLGQALTEAAHLPQMVERFAEAVEAGAAVMSYPGDVAVLRCPGKGDRLGCGNILRRGWRLCTACNGLPASHR